MADAHRMGAQDRELSLRESALAVLVLCVVMLVSTPQLESFPGALTPWPAHGIAMAIVIATPASNRKRLGLLLTAAVFAVCIVNAFRVDGTVLRAVGATVLLVGQTFFTVLLYDRATRGAPPLSGTVPYAYLLAAAAIGSVPVIVLGALGIAVFGAATAAQYSGWLWWTASASSGVALLGGTLVILSHPWRGREKNTEYLLEFVILVSAYAVALFAAFAERGPLAGAVTPALAALPFLVWAGMRFGVRGFGVLAALLIVVVIASTWMDVGPYARMEITKPERFRRAWVFLAATVGPAMIFPVALAERSASAQRARDALAQLRAIIEGSVDLMAAVDRSHIVLAANASWVERFERGGGLLFVPGRSRAEDAERSVFERASSIALWDRALAGERFTVTRSVGVVGPSHEEFEITFSPIRDDRGDIAGASQVVRDVTLRRRREFDESEARRLESVGRLAGGVAHDFNNLMTAVLGYTELLRATFAPDDPRASDLTEVERAATRAGILTQHLLAFARRRDVQPRDVDVSELVTGILRLLAPLLESRVTVTIDAPPGLRTVLVDPAQFEQVVMNLALNARDAMPDGGTLTIATSEETRVGSTWIRLRVRDTGVGMPPDVKERIFEPFFTTKPVGNGTGLGLATVHGIVKQAGGSIDVESAPDAGTTFDIFFRAHA